MSYKLIELFHKNLDWIKEWTDMDERTERKLVKAFDKKYSSCNWDKARRDEQILQ